MELSDQVYSVLPSALSGSVVQWVGTTVAAAGLPAPVGAIVEIQRQGDAPLEAEVIGFRDHLTLLHPLGEAAGVRHGNRARLVRTSRWLRVGPQLLGRVIDAEGRVIDGQGPPLLTDRAALSHPPPEPCQRPRIDLPLSTGIRALDGFLTCGRGQRLGIFSGSGVGKSITLGMIARWSAADVIVIALIGERGREVNEFLQRDLGPEGRSKSVVVVATSNEPAILRVHAAETATAVAEYFRDAGKDVLLMMDSLTRLALAQREIGLAAGEPPTTRGFPPSVFALLPRLVERAGRSSRGSITAFYTVLVEGDDPHEPISDTLRGLLDGHVWLSRRLAARGHYPAIDVLESLSRLMPDVADPEHRRAAALVRELLAVYRDHEDLISIGAYHPGSNRRVDVAIEMLEAIESYLRQDMSQRSSLDEARRGLLELAARAAKDLAAKNARPEVAAATVMQKHGVPSAHRPDQQVPLSLRERARVRGPAAEDAR